MTQLIFSASDFRRRALEHVGAPLDHGWEHHGNHALNGHVDLVIQDMPLKDAAVLIGVIDDDQDARIILTQRTSKLRQHAGQIAFPGGGIDDTDQTPEEAALREAEEEIGLDRRFVETVGRLPQSLTGTGFRIQPVLAVVRPGYTITPNPDEVESVFEVPLSFLMDPSNHSQDSRMLAGAMRRFYVMPYGERRIWGITAGLIRTLYERLYA
ncbi:CoA pyrophosphatase [Peteryoungia desertarenae]|uniref:CoA pyrophosphatase n=1 Tax=Peteryoungia desertarenae TaxID=1813451 RepID=A0ABX6QR58_9HYPH|nr:CoA pyrophosphatase [Peteryoungia desertarenae]QLF70994.1 CoA pyrophosphatase [Peteryoungia desertarenae]